MAKPPFPWIGSKEKIAPYILQLFPPKLTQYVEPFGGSGAVLLALPPDPNRLDIYNDLDIPTDLNHNSDFVVRSHPAVLDGFVSFYRKAVQALNLFGAEHCVGDRAEQDYTGKVLVLSPEALREQYWGQDYQLLYARSGFGCEPHSSGRAVFATCLSDGETARWNREDFIGVLDEKCLPDWAREKLMELTAPRQEEPAAGEMKLE